ncbi:acylneuraminate cytidylyltransferase family protein [Maridesulfovibrio hydrothermalis]|uniref:N-acetylneuraminate cytidylyltransferase n=1 Tax=Maridesulfovibrio hydrothermalis AM13 = DSM 14728 TaxID=1121451 RepID=L0RAL3_9BACT|nr:acylneuraminate cytidylyltransferase family protein [Maridesulfovibrio hydrothermalis]CCO23230.1 N-acetylneuraminate cytidylyltransferase [Maridesulfovibrio hydrothermalis AM13 = DSM 14728]
MSSKAIAIIPARGGSKRILKKNIKKLLGKPMIGYTIEAAFKSGIFDKIVVSTDCPEIAEISSGLGAEVPFLRAKNIADNTTPVSVATLDALDRIDPNKDKYNFVCQLMANCPMRDETDIISSYEKLITTGTQSQISVSGYGWLKPNWAVKINKDQTFDHVFPLEINERSQDTESLYCPNGTIWWSSTATLRKYKSFFHNKTTVHKIPLLHSIDIDELEDFEIAKILLGMKNE